MPLFGAREIPRDVAVDPAQFSEEEYPVNCPKCGYLLRGLPDGNCPECGKPFERGRLLVLQYVHGWRGEVWRQSKPGIWCRRLFVLGFVFNAAALAILICFAAPEFRNSARPSTLAADHLDFAISILVMALMLVGMAILVIGAVMTLVTFPHHARQCRRAVVAAIGPQQTPH